MTDEFPVTPRRGDHQHQQQYHSNGFSTSPHPGKKTNSSTTIHAAVAPEAAALESVMKTLSRLVSIPSNRSCADCKSPLVDALQVYVSYSNDDHWNNNFNFRHAPSPLRPTTFHQNHYQLAPPGALKRKIPVVHDPPVDPAVTVSAWCGHGVFVCALCGAAHKLLSNHGITTVAAVHDPHHWTWERVQILARAGGNARATNVLEAYYTPLAQSVVPRPNSSRAQTNGTLADRLTFCRAKYEALAFCLPPAVGPCAREAWRSLVQRHEEWKTLWTNCNGTVNDGTDWTLLPSLSGLELKRPNGGPPQLNYFEYHSAQRIVQEQQCQPLRTADLPDRLVDYFCVVTASDFVHPLCKDLTHAQSPEDILLAPRVSDCFPNPAMDSAYENRDDDASLDSAHDPQCPAFPEHVSTFVFPDGCYASTTALPPSFFTLVLTNAAGERLYGGVLRLYDDCVDTVETLQRILDNSEYPENLRPLWLRQKTTTQQQQHPISSNPLHTPPSKQPPRSMSSSSIRTSDSYHSQASSGGNNGNDVMFLPKCLVIISHYPFFDLWRSFLLQIYRIALTEAPLPIERFVTNFGQYIRVNEEVDSMRFYGS